ncbi:MAG: molybdenum ABC transporter ATP-binding protein [Acidobacteriales bacterium]|nr:molybdenum ABC transporter ATP-binding protein [Terriglobales bacterium]
MSLDAPPAGTCSVRISKQFAAHDFELVADLIAPPGITILFGASGAGKTTLLDCVAGLTIPDSGQIKAGDCVFFDNLARINLPVRYRNVGYVLQHLALFPHLSVRENLEFGLRTSKQSERRRKVDEILESFRIGNLSLRKPSEISGGERQRVALGRALVINPRILLLDEPLGGLDAPTKSKIVDDLLEWNREHQIPILYVTHSRDEVFALGERVVVLEKGRVVAQGAPHEVMTVPRQETVAQLFGFENIFNATVVAAHENLGTLTCRLDGSTVELETPLVRAEPGSLLRLGIAAGDILLATVKPEGLSARNVLPAVVKAVAQRDAMVMVEVDCGTQNELRIKVRLTLGARDSLALENGRQVWVIVKTHSCHLMA